MVIRMNLCTVSPVDTPREPERKSSTWWNKMHLDIHIVCAICVFESRASTDSNGTRKQHVDTLKHLDPTRVGKLA
jgi:hypothetical protein